MQATNHAALRRGDEVEDFFYFVGGGGLRIKSSRPLGWCSSRERVSRRKALCRHSMVSVENPRRSSPVAFAANTFISRVETVVE